MKTSLKRLLSICLVFAMVLSLAACGEKKPEAKDPEPVVEEKTTLRIAAYQEPQSLDLQSINLSGNRSCAKAIFDTLVVMNSDGILEPSVAKSWEWVDAQTLKLNLRDDVVSSKGTKLTASDVIFCFTRGKNCAALAAKYASLDMENSYAENDTTVILKLVEPFTNILYSFTQGCFVVYCQKDFEEIGADKFSHNPVGTGAYEFKSWITGTSLSATRRSDYWGKPGTFENIEWYFITDENSRVMALESGDVDVAESISYATIDTVAKYDQLYSWPGNSLRGMQITFNVERAPFSDQRVRYAISEAMDLNGIANLLTKGMGTGWNGFWHDRSPYSAFKGQAYKQDIEDAKKLLAEAGYPDGFEMSVMILNQAAMTELAQAMQNELKKIGITLKIDTVERSAFFSRHGAGEFDCFMQSMTGFVPEDVLSFFDSTKIHGNGNPSGYVNPEFDALANKAKAETNDAARAEIYKQIDELLDKEAVQVNLIQREDLYASIKGLAVTETDSLGSVEYTHVAYTK